MGLVKETGKALLDSTVKKVFSLRPSWNKDFSVKKIAAQAKYDYALPRNVELLSEKDKVNFYELLDAPNDLPERNVYLLTNVFVSWHGTVFKNFRIFIPSLLHHSVVNQYADSFLLKQWFHTSAVVKPTTTVAVVHNQFSAINYFHWLIEALPRLLLIKDVDPNCYLLAPAPVPEFLAKTAALLGFSKLLPIDRNQLVKASRVLLPEATHLHGHQDPLLMQQVRMQLIKALGYPETTPHRRIYVSRSRQRMRKLVNEEALDSVLAHYSFEKVFFEELSFEEQVQTALEASIMMGVHGANLTNMLFMQPSTTVIELMNEDHANLVYFRMASYLHITYYNVPCRIADAEENTNNANILIDLNILNNLLSSIII